MSIYARQLNRVLRSGERFSINAPDLPPCLTPLPENDVEFLQDMLDGLSEIERIGYTALQQLGAPTLKRVFPVGDAQSSNASAGVARIAAGLI